MGGAQGAELANVGLGLALLSRQALAGESRGRVARPSAGKILAHGAVVVLGAVEQLGSVVNAWNSAKCIQHAKAELEAIEVLAHLAKEATLVVVVKKGNEVVAGAVESVEVVGGQGVVDVGHAFVPAAGALHRLFESPVHREVGSPGEVRMRFEVKRLGVCAVYPGLTVHIKLRLKGLYGGHPVAHKRLIRVQPRVDAEPVKLGFLDPPQAVLNEVAGTVGVAAVYVRHRAHKPTVGLALAVSG